MPTWSDNEKEHLTLLIKDWLKQQGRAQADLRESLQASSTRMQAIIEVLERDQKIGGLVRVADRLCKVEAAWNGLENRNTNETSEIDPFGQLDLILEEIKEDSKN